MKTGGGNRPSGLGLSLSACVLRLEEAGQILHRIDEVTFASEHRKVDRVEVRLAVEAADEILLRVEIGTAFATTRTDEDELATAAFVGPVEAEQELGERERRCGAAGEAPQRRVWSSIGPPQGSWNSAAA